MRTLIAYATKGGASRECAEILASEIGGCTICDLDGNVPDIKDFDTVVIGTGIRVGKAYKPFKKFLEGNTDALLTRNIAFFVCCVVMKEFEKTAVANIPETLRNAAFRIGAFGGKPLLGGKKDQRWMLKDNVAEFAKAMKEKA
ncbi:MAG: flavodoxin domain-containing protein [Methanomassiliicoccaceae archaeon]|jgi:menaquinone-dependent protoporphyrinogen oxidase|nr:flavodoxin domain-containing protein [Methanomassiliicoccaceae archaeon]